MSAIFSAMNRRAFDDLHQWFVPNLRINDQAWSLSQLQADLCELLVAFPDFYWSIDHVLVDGEFVHTRYHASGTRLRPLRGFPAQESKLVLQQMVVLQFRGRLATNMWITSGQPVHAAPMDDDSVERKEGHGAPYDRP